MYINDAIVGKRVIYVPNHANGDITHKDCELGVISSKVGNTIFVKYDNSSQMMLTGKEPYTPQGTNPKNLVYDIDFEYTQEEFELWAKKFKHNITKHSENGHYLDSYVQKKYLEFINSKDKHL